MEEESDQLWQEFVISLNGLNATPIATRDEPTSEASIFEEGDDPNDPDYNLFKDLQNIDFDEDLNFDEYLDFLNEPPTCDGNTSTASNTSTDKPIDEKEQFTPEQFRTLQSQLSFHVQALTQTWMLSTSCEELKPITNHSKQMLLELNEITKAKNGSPQLNTALETVYTSSAIKLIEERGAEVEQAEKRNSFNRVSEFSRKLISSRRDIFKFDWAFPNIRFIPNSAEKESKKKFSLAEDFLIAIGLSESTKSKSKRIFNIAFKKMQEMKFLPSKSEATIRFRIKHLRRVLAELNSASEESLKQDARLTEFSTNPIICFLRDGKLPPVHSCFVNPLLDTYRKYRRSPRWFNQLTSDKDEKELQIDETGTQSDDSLHKKSRLIVPKVEFCTIESSLCHPISFSNQATSTVIFPSIESPPLITINIPAKRRNSKRVISTSNSDNSALPKKKRKVRFAEKAQIHIIENLVDLGPSPVPKTNSRDSGPSEPVKTNSKSDKSNRLPANATKSTDDGVAVAATQSLLTVIEENYASPISIECDSENQCPEAELIRDDGEITYNSMQTSPCEDNEGDDDIVEEEEEFVVPENIDELIEDEEVEEDDDEDKLAVDEDIEADECKDPMDDENDLNALMMASCTAVSNRARHSSAVAVNEGETGMVAKRKSHAITRQRDSSLYLLQKQIAQSNQPEEEEQRKEMFVGYYMKRAQVILTPDEYVQFLQVLVTLLHDHCTAKRESNSANPKVVFQRIKQFLIDLRDKYAENTDSSAQQNTKTVEGIQELINMLVLFLDFSQALACGESFNYLHWRRIFDFMRNVELYLGYIYTKRSQQLGCIQRLIKSLNQIGQMKQPDTGQMKLKIKSVVSKILNGHTLLVSEFSSLFLDDSPPRYLYANAEDFDEFTLVHNDDQFNGDLPICQLENVTVPLGENDLKYGTSECPCRLCHSTTADAVCEQLTQTQMKHCQACSIRFIAGRLYVPQFNSSTKKMQLVEHVPQEEANISEVESICSDTNNNNQKVNATGQSKPVLSSAAPKVEWTMAEDRILLEACRTVIVDSQITQLTDKLFENVAQRLTGKFERRTTKELGERLRQLIEMLTTTNGKP